MAASKPLVSAIITTHNRVDLLPRALDSVIAQSYPNIEIIVVDDGSVDETPELIEKYRREVLITYLRLEESVGAPRARNKGIEAAKGEFIAGLDDDDKWHEDRIDDLMGAHSDEFSCVTSDTIMVFPGYQAPWKKKATINFNRLLYTNQVGNQVLVRRDRVLAVGGYDSHLSASQDYDLWVRLSEAYGPIRNVQKPLQTIYMDHESERITDQSWKGYLQFYNKHKQRFNRPQRKYKLFNIRRAQGKSLSLSEFTCWVPAFRYFDEVKNIIARMIRG